jgi:hypothetical protein
MKELTVVLDDDALTAAVEAEAVLSGRTVQDVMVEALKQWLADSDLDERERADIEEARREHNELGGVEAREIFDDLRHHEA